MIKVRAFSVPFLQARTWSQSSLEQGSTLAEFVSQRLAAPATAFVMASESSAVPELDDDSRFIDQHDADILLGEYFQYLASMGSGLLVVEDDTAREGDSSLDDVVLVEGRVLRWEELQTDPSRLTQLIRRGASGYPLNAFVCDERGRTILQRAGSALSVDDALSLSQSVQVVINSVYDAESYLVIDFNAPA